MIAGTQERFLDKGIFYLFGLMESVLNGAAGLGERKHEGQLLCPAKMVPVTSRYVSQALGRHFFVGIIFFLIFKYKM